MDANNRNPNDEWSDEQLEAALRRLDEMHRQLRALRSTIPRMIKPLTTPHESREYPSITLPLPFRYPPPPPPQTDALQAEALYRDFARAAETADKEVKAFRRFRSERGSRAVFERAERSRAVGGEGGIVVWSATEYPGAFDSVMEGGGKDGGG